MNRIVLPFDKEDVSEEEIKDHINWYVEKAREGMKLVDFDNRNAMIILREINKNLKEERSYYDKNKVSDILYTGNKLKNRYFHALNSAFVKQSRKTSYEMLSSNLYDVYDYMSDTEE